jgi:phage protein D
VGHAFRILVGGTAVDPSLYTDVRSLDVEENVDLPGAFSLSLPVASDGSGDYTYVNDSRFQPFSKLAVEVDVDDGGTQCIFDGVILSHKFHVDRGTSNATLEVWGQDASWLMNVEEKIKEWSNVTDGDVANSIFGDYGFAPDGDNTSDDSPSHTEDGHTLMQRASDIQFLRALARRSGKICRVAPGTKAGQITGVFTKPKLDGDPAVKIPFNDLVHAVVGELDFTWDVTRPTEVKARQALFNDNDEDGADGGATDSGLASLADRDLATFSGQAMKALLTATVDDAGELQQRSRSLLREASFFVRCTGEADLDGVGAVLRAGTVVQIDGAGSLNSGKYYVWSVRHHIEADAHGMRFVLVRNAVGPQPSGGGGGLGL